MEFRRYIALVGVALILTAFACGPLGAAETKPTDKVTEADSDTMDGPGDVFAAVALGDEHRSEAGGYSFATVPGYDVQEFYGLTTMAPPDADPDIGPLFFIVGAVNEEGFDLESGYQDFLTEAGSDVEVSNEFPMSVDGLPGRAADVSGENEGVQVAGRIFFGVNDQQQLTVLAMSEASKWPEIAPIYDAVLASFTLFEPDPDAGADLLGEETADESSSQTDNSTSGEEVRQWATEATASSQYGDDGWSASQATGEPDVYPECTDSVSAWASASGDGVDWLELTYDVPVYVTQIRIYQTLTPNQVTAVELIDAEGNYKQIYARGAIETECPYILTLSTSVTYLVTAIRITVDESALGYWNEIDAVELVGTTDS